MKGPWLKLFVFLIPAIAGTLFVLWRFSPEQAIIRRADAVFASFEKKTFETGTTIEKAERLQTILHPDFHVRAPLPVPSGPLPPARAADYLRNLQDSITTSRISRSDERVTFPSDGRAIYEATIEVQVSVGTNSPRVLRYRCQLEFRRDERDWLLHSAVLTAI